jgi:hypothetical protein
MGIGGLLQYLGMNGAAGGYPPITGFPGVNGGSPTPGQGTGFQNLPGGLLGGLGNPSPFDPSRQGSVNGPAGVGQGHWGTPYGYMGSVFGGSRNGGGQSPKSNMVGNQMPHPGGGHPNQGAGGGGGGLSGGQGGGGGTSGGISGGTGGGRQHTPLQVGGIGGIQA